MLRRILLAWLSVSSIRRSLARLSASSSSFDVSFRQVFRNHVRMTVTPELNSSTDNAINIEGMLMARPIPNVYSDTYDKDISICPLGLCGKLSTLIAKKAAIKDRGKNTTVTIAKEYRCQ